MRVLVQVLVDLDPNEYREEYGEDYTVSEIRDMVKADIHDSIDWNFVNKFPAFKSVEVR